MGALDPPGVTRATADRRSAYRRRAMPPVGSTLATGTSPEAFTGSGVTWSTTDPGVADIANPKVLTPSSPAPRTLAANQFTAHGGLMALDVPSNAYRNGLNGGGTRAAYAIGVDYYGAHIGFKVYTFAPAPHYWLWVDDKPVTTAPVALSGQSVGANYYIDIPFTTTGFRRIKLWLRGCDFGGYTVSYPDGHSPAPPAPWNILFWGDSWTEGANNVYLDTWALQMARAAGADAFLCGQGSTGYVALGSGASSNFGSTNRLAAAATLKPDLIWVAGSVNDASVHAQVQAAATTFYAALDANYPGVPVIVQGVQAVSGGAGSSSNYNLANAAILAATQSASNVIAMVSPRTEGWMSGTGNVAAPQGDGFADSAFASDYVHMTAVGNSYVGRRSLAKLHQILAT